MRRTINFTRATAANITNGELYRTADGVVCPVALTKCVDAGVHANCTSARTVTNNHWANGHRCCQYSVHIELVVAHCFKCCDNPRHVFRKTTGHYCVDCNFLNSELHQVRWRNCNHVLWVTSSSCQHPQYAFTCWRDYRKAIGPTACIHCFEFIFSI